jgi:hypothetical protein
LKSDDGNERFDLSLYRFSLKFWNAKDGGEPFSKAAFKSMLKQLNLL